MTELERRLLQPAAQYLRMSSDSQRYSLESQAALIAQYAQTHGLDIVRSYEDAGLSGVTAKRREGLKALLRDVLAGQAPYATILVVDVSRWGRFQDPDEAAHYEFICREAGVRVEYCAELFPNDGSGSAAILKTLKRVMAAEYSRHLSDRTSAGKRRRIIRGFAAGGAAPYGVRRQAFNEDGTPAELLSHGERRRRLDQAVRWVRGPEEEVHTIQAIFELFVKRAQPMAPIAASLNRRGVRYVRGLPWTDWRVKAVLTSETAIGNYVYNKETGQFAFPGRKLPPGNWLRVRILAPVVSRARFAAAQRRLAELQGCWMTDEEMLDRLKALLRRHGRLSATVMRRTGARPSVTAYYGRFGSLKTAFARIGYVDARYPRRTEGKEKYQRDYILKRLRALHDEHGHVTTKLLEAASDLPSPTFIRRQFGNLSDAYRLAGINASRGDLLRAAWARRRAKVAITSISDFHP